MKNTTIAMDLAKSVFDSRSVRTSAELLIQDAELQIGPRYCDNDVPRVLDHGHSAISAARGPADWAKFDVDFEVGAITANKCPRQWAR
jgi:hypothetical protein